MAEVFSTFEINATTVYDAVATTPRPHPNQVRTALSWLDRKIMKDGKVVRVSQGAWDALARYQEKFRGITSKTN